MYFKAWRHGPNIGEHCPTLRMLATECQSVTEFGTDLAVSTTAFLSAQPARLTTYDTKPSQEAEKLRPFSGKTNLSIVQANTLEVEIESTDLLLIDSFHNYSQLSAEFARHAESVRRWIVLHDTVTFGEIGEDKTRGLTPAINEFLNAHPEWKIVAEYKNSHGLTVIRRFSS